MMNYNNSYFPQQLRVIVINSVEEATKIPADINGTPLFFYNRNTNEIYVKQFYIGTGITTFDKYIKSDGISEPNKSDKKENDINIYDDKFNAINNRLDGLQKQLDDFNLRGGKNGK